LLAIWDEWDPSQTHLNQLIYVFRITRKLQAEEFIRAELGDPSSRYFSFNNNHGAELSVNALRYILKVKLNVFRERN